MIYQLIEAGIECFDVYTREGRFAGLITSRPDGTFRHRYNSTGSRGSARKFPSVAAALESIHARRERLIAKRAAA